MYSDAVPDSAKTITPPQKIRLYPVWETLSGNLASVQDSATRGVFRFEDLLRMNYNGTADAFRYRSRYSVTDFVEPGLPRFVSGLNLYPHQTGVYFEGQPVNDPVNGLYNLRFVSLDALSAIEAGASPLLRNRLSDAIQLTARTLIPEQPYTRLMYREGDFGYLDLDIQFAKRFSDRFSVQLGGINKYYDPNGYRGYAFRGLFHTQLGQQLYSRTRFHLNRELVHFIPRTAEYLTRRREERNAFTQDFFLFDPDSASGFWQAHFGATSSRRHLSETLRDSFDLFVNFDQYDLEVRRRWSRAEFQMDHTVNLFQTRIWGTSFYRRYVDSGVNSDHALKWRIRPFFTIMPAVNIRYREGFDPLILPAISIGVRFPKVTLHASATRSARFPDRNELSFNDAPFSGNKNLQPEKISDFQTQFFWQPQASFKLELNAGYKKITNEILLTGTTFQNSNSRSFDYLSFRTEFKYSTFRLLTGGQINDAALNISPPKSFWLQLHYRDGWLKNKIIIDATAGIRWFDEHLLFEYTPQLERFSVSTLRIGSYFLPDFKLSATIKSAQLFFAIDNPFATQYQIVYGYPEYYRRVRVGVNWVLWD